MRFRSNVAAEQLHSVAMRFQQAVRSRCGDDSLRRNKTWRLRTLVCPGDPLDGISQAGESQRLEAILFLASQPLNSRTLCRHANLADATQARTLVRQLNQRYDRLGRAFRVEEVAGGFQLRSRARFGPWIRRLEHVRPEPRLSAPALETLSVVAYRQPVLRADVEAIRGVNCGEILRQLMERDFVCVTGRSDELGRPYFYGTTTRFLQVFGLRGLDELPRKEAIENLASLPPSTDNRSMDTSPPDSEPGQEKNDDEEKDVSVTWTKEQQPADDFDEMPERVSAAPHERASTDSWDDDKDDGENGDDEDDDDEEEFADGWQEVEDDDDDDDDDDDEEDDAWDDDEDDEDWDDEEEKDEEWQ